MRITAGSLRGRRVRVPDLPGLRPTPAKVRQAIFNILGSVEGLAWLDLYAGSGIMALEALSRGAACAVSIERHPQAVRAMQAVNNELKPGNWRMIRASIEQGLARLSGQHFDLVFADPPYATGAAARIPAMLDAADISSTRLIIEESAREQPHWPPGWQCLQVRSYGDTALHFLRRDAGFL